MFSYQQKKIIKKMPRMQIYIFALVSIFVSFGIFSTANQAQAKPENCGDGIAVCACGNTVMASTTLMADLDCSAFNGDALTIGANGITVDGGGFSIISSDPVHEFNGIYVPDVNNITIKNFAGINGFDKGIYFFNSTSSTVMNNNLSSDNEAIKLLNSSGNILTGNTASSSTSGIVLVNSLNNSLTSNITNFNLGQGVYLYNAAGTTMIGNTMASNVVNLLIDGDADGDFAMNINTTNLVQGLPVYYLYNQSNQTYDNPVGGVGMFWCISCNNIIFKNATLAASNAFGVYLRNTSSSTVQNITADSNERGMVLVGSSNNNLISNITSLNISYGISLSGSTNNTLTGNTSNSNDMYGIALEEGSINNTLTGNTSNSNRTGLYLLDSTNNTLTGNTSNSNENGGHSGAGVILDNAAGTTMLNNTMTDNQINLNIHGTVQEDYNMSVNTTNLVQGLPVYYFYHHSNQTYDNPVGGVGMFWCISCTNITFKNTVLAPNNYRGVFLRNTSSSTVQNIIANLNNEGIEISSSVDNNLIGNTISYNYGSGIGLRNSTSSILTGNIANHNTSTGIVLLNSINNTLTGNTSNSNQQNGFYISNSSNSNTLTSNITNFNQQNGFYIQNSTNNNLNGNIANSNNSVGIILSSAPSNILINNTANYDSKGIQITSSASSTITGNNLYFNKHGVDIGFSNGCNLIDNNLSFNKIFGINISSSNNTLLDNNSFSANNQAIYLATASSTTVINNSMIGNVYDVYDSRLTNVYTGNQSSHNLNNQMLSFVEMPRKVTLGETINFDFSMFKMSGNDCPDCTYSLSTSPSEILTASSTGNRVTGSFVPTRTGIYSLKIIITDSSENNITKRNFIYFVNSNKVATTKYYLRSAEPTHGQPIGTDVGSLVLAAPVVDEMLTSTSRIQSSPDEVTSYPLANLLSVDSSTWYKVTAPGSIGLQRLVTYDNTVDSSEAVAVFANPTQKNIEFSNLNWIMDYPQSWYKLAFKLVGGNAITMSTPSQTSYADFTYEYTTTPTIKAVSNTNINILSATSPADTTNSAQIVLENTLTEATSTVITLSDFNLPLLNTVNTIYSDGTTTAAVDIEADASTTINTVPLNITPSSGSVTIAINTWNTSGNYYKKWTEEGSGHDISTQHTVGDLKPNTNYLIKVGGGVYYARTSNSAGEITFIYNGGYSTKTFEIEEGSIGSIPVTPPATGGGAYTVTIPMDQTGDLGLVETTGVNSLSYIGSISSFNTLVGRSYTIEKHKIKIMALDLTKKIITILVESEPQTLTIKLTELAKVDLNNDQAPDISIEFSSLYVNRAELTIKSLLNQTIVKATPEMKPVVPANTSMSAIKAKYTFKRNLSAKMTGSDVKELQKYLNTNGYLLSKSGAGSKGKETTFFGPATRLALIKFQKAKKITPANGLFGPQTRGAVNK